MQRLAMLVTGVLVTLSLVRAQEPANPPPAPRGPFVPTAFVTVPGGDEAARPGPADPGPRSPLQAVQALPFPQENLTTFDYRLTEVQWQGDHWQLVAAGRVLKDFGRHEAQANEALRIVRELRLTQHGMIGTPRPVMEYWLADGQAPRAFDTRLRVVSFDPHALRAEEVQGQWCLRDSRTTLFNFGAHTDDAFRALEVIRRHGFNQVGFVGQPIPVLIYFLAGDAGPTASPIKPLPTLASRTDRLTDAAPHRTVGHQPGNPITATPTKGLPGSGLTPAAFPMGRQLNTPTPLLPDAAEVGSRVPIDWRQVQARKENDGWKLAYGEYVLARFGSNEREAKQAHSVLQYYHFTEQCLVGKAPGTFCYYLVNGQPPRGSVFGVRAQDFRPDHVTVERVGGAYVVADANRLLVNCGPQEEAAKQLVKIIQRYQFDRLCRIGSEEAAPMTFFARVR
jgi:hypothetical protein